MARTLNEILERVPIVLRKRYSTKFWVHTLNRVLQDIQFEFQIPELTEDHGLFLEEEIYDYEIPEFIKKVLGVYKTNFFEADSSGNFDHNRLSIRRDTDKLAWRQRGQWIEIIDSLNASDTKTVDNALLEDGSTKRKMVNSTDFIGDGLDFRGHLFQFSTGKNAGRNQIIVKHDNVTGEVTLKRPFPYDVDSVGNPAYGEVDQFFHITTNDSSELVNAFTVEIVNTATAGSETIDWSNPGKVVFNVEVGVSTVAQMLAGTQIGTPWATVANLRPNETLLVDIAVEETQIQDLANVTLGKTADQYQVGKHYAMVVYAKDYEKAEQISCPIQVNTEMEAVLEDGLRYYGEYQTDEESEFTAKFYQMYDKSKRLYLAKQARGVFSTQPRFPFS